MRIVEPNVTEPRKCNLIHEVRWRSFVRPGLATALFCILLPAGYVDSMDAGARLLQTEALLLRRSVSIPSDLLPPGSQPSTFDLQQAPDGRLYSKYGLGMSLVWCLPVAAAYLVSLLGFPLRLLAGAAVTLVNPLIILLTALSVYNISRRLLGDGKGAHLTVILFLGGTTALPYANGSWTEPVTGLLVLWAFALPVLASGIQGGVASGLLLAFAAQIKPELAVLVIPQIVLLTSRRRWQDLGWPLLAASAGPASILVLNLLLRGSPFRFSYGAETRLFGSPLEGLHGYFLGAEKNLLLFNPMLLVCILAWIWYRKQEPLGKLGRSILVAWVILVPLYASWHSWEGGFSFGPRFLFTLVPLSVLPAGHWCAAKLYGHQRARWTRYLVASLLFLILAFSVPFQMAGASVKDYQAYTIAEVTGETVWCTKLKLLWMKLGRGIRGPEVWRKSDFVRLNAGEPDCVFDDRSCRSCQYLNYWWSLYLANRARGRTPWR
jgi:hypothetical protein